MSNVCNLAVIFVFFGGYLLVTARYIVVTAGYCLLPGGYYSLLVVTACYSLLQLIPTFSINVRTGKRSWKERCPASKRILHSQIGFPERWQN